MSKLNKYLKIYLLFFKVNVLQRMAYRWNFLLILILNTLYFGVYIYFINIIYSNLTLIAGWDYFHSLLIIATYIFVDSLSHLTCAVMSDLRYRIKDGTLDLLAIKPIDTQFLVSVNKIDPAEIFSLGLGILVLAYAMGHLAITFGNFLLYLFFVLNGFLIFYSVMVIVSSLAFWFIDSNALSVVNFRILRLAQYTTDVYSGIIRIFFTFIIPIAFLATVPAKILSGWYDWRLIMETLIITIFFIYLSRILFYRGLRNYSSASS